MVEIPELEGNQKYIVTLAIVIMVTVVGFVAGEYVYHYFTYEGTVKFYDIALNPIGDSFTLKPTHDYPKDVYTFYVHNVGDTMITLTFTYSPNNLCNMSYEVYPDVGNRTFIVTSTNSRVVLAPQQWAFVTVEAIYTRYVSQYSGVKVTVSPEKA